MSFKYSLGAFALLASTASALTPADITLAPGLTATLVHEGPTLGGMEEGGALAGGALLVAFVEFPPGTLHRVNLDGTVELLATFADEIYGAVPDAATGAIWVAAPAAGGQSQLWRIEGLPRTLSAGGCPIVPGDVAPGVLTGSTWRPEGDGIIDVGDVVITLRASVGFIQIVCSP